MSESGFAEKTPQLSAVVITRNEARRIERCIDSLSFADEILVVDSESDDDTVARAQTGGARTIVQAWLGYGGQKDFAVKQASNDWVLYEMSEFALYQIEQEFHEAFRRVPLTCMVGDAKNQQRVAQALENTGRRLFFTLRHTSTCR